MIESIIILVSGKEVIIDKEDLSKFEIYKWHINIHGHILSNGGSVGKRRKDTVMLHRLVLNYFGSLYVDHINRNTLDNRKCNLRLCTPSLNKMNTTKSIYSRVVSSKYKGVRWHKQRNKWEAKITYKGRSYYLGYFNSEIEAAKAYDKKALELAGNFAYLNIK